MLVAIYNLFDGEELLKGSMKCIAPYVDAFIIVWQDVSNYGEIYNPMLNIDLSEFNNVNLIQYHPDIIKSPRTGMINEARKRNLGLNQAKIMGADYFIILDVDEYYKPDEFEKAKTIFLESGKRGSVCKMWTYFKSPTLRLENSEDYYVPIFHKLDTHTFIGNLPYPFRVDHTRAVNNCKASDVIELPLKMFHYSWVRKNIERKARNSSARHLAQHMDDYNNAAPGYFLPCYQQKLIEDENYFNINL